MKIKIHSTTYQADFKEVILTEAIKDFAEELLGSEEMQKGYVDQDHIKSGCLQTHNQDGKNEAISAIKSKIKELCSTTTPSST